MGVGDCGGEGQEGGGMCIPTLGLIPGDLWQQPTQYCIAIIFQLKKKRMGAEESQVICLKES